MKPLTCINNDTCKYRVDDTQGARRIASIVLYILHKKSSNRAMQRFTFLFQPLTDKTA